MRRSFYIALSFAHAMKQFLTVFCFALYLNPLNGQEVQQYLHKSVTTGEHVNFVVDGVSFPDIIRSTENGKTFRTYIKSGQYNIQYRAPENAGLDTLIYSTMVEEDGEMLANVEAYIFEVKPVRAKADFFAISNSETSIELNVLDNDLGLEKISSILFQDYVHAEVNDDSTALLLESVNGFEGMAHIVYLSCNDIACSKGYVELRIDDPNKSYNNDTLRLRMNKNEQVTFQVPYGYFPLNDYDGIGELRALGAQQYAFESIHGFVGTRTLQFFRSDNFRIQDYYVTIDVANPFDKNGWSNDDYIYTSPQAEVSFNVLENDLHRSDISIKSNDLKGQLVDLGNGDFTFVSDPGFNGVTYFSYELCNGAACNTSNVYITVHDYKPAEPIYKFAISKNQWLELDYDAPISNYAFQLISPPSFGTVEFADLNRFILYTPDYNYSGSDVFLLQYCVDGSCDIVRIVVEVMPEEYPICFTQCVWPGDANNDGDVNAADALVIGANLGLKGAARSDIEFDAWYPRDVETWPNQFSLGTSKLASTDTDGDGITSVLDTALINYFYGFQHQMTYSSIPISEELIELSVSTDVVEFGDVLSIDLHLGNLDHMIEDFMGLSFSIELSGDISFETYSMQILNDAWIGQQSGVLEYDYSPKNGFLDVSLVRTSADVIIGAGQIGTLHIVIEEEIEDFIDQLKTFAGKGFVEIKNVQIVGNSGAVRSLPGQKVELEVLPRFIAREQERNFLGVFPNPAVDVFTAYLPNFQPMFSLEVVDTYGKRMFTYEMSDNPQKAISVNTSEWALKAFIRRLLERNMVMLM